MHKDNGELSPDKRPIARPLVSLRRSAAIVGIAMVLSRILGFFRYSVIAALFGQGFATDAFNAAYLVPDTIYMILIGGGISSAFIPVLSRYLAEQREDEVWRVTSIAFNAVAVGMLVVLGVGFIVAPWYLHLLLPGFGEAKLALTTGLTRIILASILFHSLNGVLIGTEYTYTAFWGTAIGPLAYNLAIILIGIALARAYGIFAFAWSTLVGSVINFLVQFYGVVRLRPRYYASFAIGHPGIRRIAHLIVPVAIGISLAQINLLVNQSFLASTLPQGSVNALSLASRVMLVPVMFAISVGIALLPGLSQQAALRDREGFRRSFSSALRAVIFVTIPASIGLLILAHPVIALLFQHGAFGEQATDLTSSTLFYYAIGVCGWGATEIISRGFYAVEDTKTPVLISAIAVVVGVVLNFAFVRLFSNPSGPGGAEGLALAYSLTGLLNAGLMLHALRRRVGPLDGVRTLRTALQALGASAAMAVIVLVVHRLTPGIPFGPPVLRDASDLLWPIAAGVVAYFACARLLGAEEVSWILSVALRRLRRA